MAGTTNSVDGMESSVLALAISAVSLLFAGLSLGWQIAQWFLSVGRAKAMLMHGLMSGPGAFVGPIGKSGKAFDLDGLRQQSVDGPAVVGIQVVNHGRAPLSVERVSLRTRGGVMQFVPVDDVLGPELPYRLEPGTNASWYVTEENAVRLVRSSRKALGEDVAGVYMTALLGTGKLVETRETLRV